MSAQLAFASIDELSSRLQTRDISASNLLEVYAERIERYSDTSNAFISLDLASARGKADTADRDLDSGLTLSGIPYSCKDLFDVAGQVTTAGSKVEGSPPF